MIKLEGTHNTRDLGGMVTLDNTITKHKVFLRSDNTHKITKKDVDILKNQYNLTTVLDFRFVHESESDEDRLSKIEGINYYNLPFVTSAEVVARMMNGTLPIYEVYKKMIESKDLVRQVFEIFGSNKIGCTLFHCSLGKDRTGIISMLLLKLANVSEEDIIENYAVSYDLIRELPEIKTLVAQYGESIFISTRDTMEITIKYIKQKYTNFMNYFVACGINNTVLEGIKSRFLQNKI
ncbi:MAG: tyrosine-protein phosphatase [Candidatus Improbicoccus devescovinae]|nr:MAG: tyrosine-protein phosphatase [Candidatus Improbicoccus devescovinae]